MTKLRF